MTAIDLLTGLGWLHPSNVDRWRQGRIEYLEQAVQVEPGRVATAIRLLGDWAKARGLEPSESPNPARSRARRELRFSATGAPPIERAYRTHWLSPEVSERERARLEERERGRPELVVIQPLKDYTCSVLRSRARRPADHGGFGPDVYVLRRHGPPGLASLRGRRADPAGKGGEPVVCNRCALHPLAQALRAPGDTGRGGCA